LIYLKKFSLDKKILFFLSCVIFISPSFRANIIWVESSMIGLFFFLIGLYYFLKNFKQFKSKNVYLNILFIAIASYIRPSYCLFAIYFFYCYFSVFRNQISIYYVILLNAILAFPAFYYVSILVPYTFFVKFDGLGSNYFDKVAIISSIIFFHSITFLYYRNFFLEEFSKKKLLFFLSLIITFISIPFFSYDLIHGGGGIILHLSNFMVGNDYLFFLFLPIFIFFILNIIKLEFSNNLVILIILLLLAPQYHIFHKYFDPLVFILCLTIIHFKLKKDFFTKKKFIFSAYLIFFCHYLISFVNSYYINF